MADKIQVAVRVRPVLFQKKDVEIHWSWSEGVVFQCEPGTSKRIGNPYLFDQVFGTETQNCQIFTKLVQPLIDSAMNGFNVTVFAYGQTASGKTYTMMGSQKELGIVQLAVDRIFTLIEQNPERAFLLRCSYIEIYNDTISDLLSLKPQKLKVQELAEGHVVVLNLIETNVTTPDAVLKLMQQGNKLRKVGETSMNERSSRSHAIFRIIVESLPRDEADRSDAAVIVSHINLVDLAGCEKASQTNATGDRFREGCANNTSLSALSLVIKQLSEGEGFFNYRDSKLTHILRASLGGNARTAIICNVTPTVLEETSSTLKFACSAKAVQNQPQVNEVLSDQALLRKYNNYIKDLEKKLKEKELEKKPEAIEEMQRLLQEKDLKINELEEQLVVSSVVISGRAESSLTSAQRSVRRKTWGGKHLKQELNVSRPALLPPVPCSEKVSRTDQQPSTSNIGISKREVEDLLLQQKEEFQDRLEELKVLVALKPQDATEPPERKRRTTGERCKCKGNCSKNNCCCRASTRVCTERCLCTEICENQEGQKSKRIRLDNVTFKVTVCFDGSVSVVVPCGNGDILVRDLISDAVTRYRRASNKPNDAAISVAALLSSDGAILDPDDRLADVVDDREKLTACFSNGGGDGRGSELEEASLGVPLVLGSMNLRGDGTSASFNSGSPSPTEFGLHHLHHGVVGGSSSHPASRKDIEVTGQEAATGLMVDHLHLQVRRGSEPALNRISPDAPSTMPNTTGSSSSSA